MCFPVFHKYISVAQLQYYCKKQLENQTFPANTYSLGKYVVGLEQFSKKSLSRTGGLEISLKCCYFLSRGFTIAVLKALGKRSELREHFMIMVVSWERQWKLASNSLAGIGSRTQVDEFILLIATLIASSVIILWNDTLGGGSRTGKCQGLGTSTLALLTHIVTIILFK